jgi:hypothetical protein
MSASMGSSSKKARTPLQIRITNLAVPLRLHIYGFLNQYDIRFPKVHTHGRYPGMDVTSIFPSMFFFAKGFRYDAGAVQFKLYMIETAFACMMGDWEVLQYLQGMPCNPWTVEKCSGHLSDELKANRFFYCLHVLIVGYNNIKTLRCARQMMFPWNEWALNAGIRHGVDLQILKWMHNQGCPNSCRTLGVAASWRDTNVLEWLLDIQCPSNERTFEFAIEANCTFENLVWLRSHGCPWDVSALNAAMKHVDSLVLVQYLLEEKCPWSSHTFSLLVREENMSLLKLFHEAGIKGDESHFQSALQSRRSIEFLQYLLKCIDSSLGASTFSVAVEVGNLSILKWLKDEGCPWDALAFSMAAKAGNMNVLNWLKDEGCPWNATAFSMATKAGNINVLKWLKEEGCPWNASVLTTAIKTGNDQIILWLCEEKCPFEATTDDDLTENQMLLLDSSDDETGNY